MPVRFIYPKVIISSMTENKKKVDTYSYKGWMLSDNFLKRAFAVFGHYIVADLIIVGTLLFLIVILMLIVFAVGSIIR